MRSLRIAVFLLVAGLLLAAVGWKEWRVHRAIEAGPRTHAVVIGEGRCPGWQSCTPSETGVSVAFRLPDGTPRGANVTVEKKDRHPVGSRLAVRYDPEHPEHVEYVRHGSRALGALITGLLCIVGSVVAGVFFRRPPLVA